MKIALFQLIKYPGVRPDVHAVTDTWLTESKEYTRVSEWIEVDFPPRSQEEVVTEQLAGLDALQNEVEKDYAVKMHAIKEKRAELAALTYRPAQPDESMVLQ